MVKPTAKAKIGRIRGAGYNPDPVFAAETQAVTEERHEAFVGNFPQRWAERMQRPLPPLHTSTQHHHDESCLVRRTDVQSKDEVWHCRRLMIDVRPAKKEE